MKPLVEESATTGDLASVVTELDDLYADGPDGRVEISFQALRSIPQLESVIKETLRLHPPLIILMRQVQEEIELAGHLIPPGTIVASSPRVSNRLAEDFPDPDSPVMTVSLSLGISRVIPLRLCSRAPRICMLLFPAMVNLSIVPKGGADLQKSLNR